MRSALSAVDCWVSGIRRQDSQSRASAPKFAWDKRFGLWKLNPLADWSEKDVWNYIAEHDIPYNELHDQGYPSIGCTHCTRKPAEGEDARARPLGRHVEDRVRPARMYGIQSHFASAAPTDSYAHDYRYPCRVLWLTNPYN